MDVRVLRTFVAVAEQRHFARAASLCNLSQPAVSHQIAQLEDEIGTKLLNRDGRRVSLTVAGEVMLEEARRILGAVDRARERMQEVVRGAVGRIRLGATTTPGLYLLPSLLARYRAEHKGYDLRFEIGPGHEIAERVARNDLDMAVIGSASPTTELQARLLARDELVIVAPPAAALAAARAVRPAQLDSETWLVREDGSETRRHLLAWWHRHHLSPPRTMTFAGPDAIKRAAMAGLGVAMTARITVEEEITSGRLVALPVRAGLPASDFRLVDHPHKHHGAACRAMLRLLSEAFPEPGEQTRRALLKRRRSALSAR